MDVLRWIVGGGLCALGVLVVGVNWWAVVRWLVSREHVGSMLPLIGGCMCSIGMALMPANIVPWAWVIPLVLDPACIPGLVGAVAMTIVVATRDRGGTSGAR